MLGLGLGEGLGEGCALIETCAVITSNTVHILNCNILRFILIFCRYHADQ